MDSREPVTSRGPLTVDRLGPGEEAAAAAVLARSFAGEPLFRFLFDGTRPAAMVRAIEPWFRGWVRSFAGAGEIHTARRDGELVGVAVRTPPGAYPLTGLRKLRFELRLLRSVLRMRLTTRRAFRMPAIGAAIARREPTVPFWNLAWLGVLPEHQRTGVGAALADEALRVIEARPAVAWVLTFGLHVRWLYERRGFELEDELQPATGGPIGWSLRREP